MSFTTKKYGNITHIKGDYKRVTIQKPLTKKQINKLIMQKIRKTKYEAEQIYQVKTELRRVGDFVVINNKFYKPDVSVSGCKGKELVCKKWIIVEIR